MDILPPASRTGQAEKDSPPNLSLRGYQVIDRVKTALEKESPGVVSCADALAIVARDVTVAGLSVKDLVVLSGGNTIGTSHCSSFTSRLYNSTGKDGTDPTLDSEYIPKLKSKCKTKAYVKLQSVATHRSTFFKDFGVSMRNMGRVGVLTGKAGEIRKVCSKICDDYSMYVIDSQIIEDKRRIELKKMKYSREKR
ncbi:peroxidase [Salix suchowensis]|nr:peroxidase [Salix suchowensis]